MLIELAEFKCSAFQRRIIKCLLYQRLTGGVEIAVDRHGVNITTQRAE